MAEIMVDPNIRNSEFLYPAEDAQQILSLAIARQTESGELSRVQLLEIAEELGISAEALAEAEREWDGKKYEIADKKLFDRQRVQRFRHSLSQFLIFSGFLVLFNLLTGGSITWLVNILLYLLFGPWALKLSWDAWRIYRPNEYGYAREFQRWRRKQKMRRAMSGFMQRLLGSS